MTSTPQSQSIQKAILFLVMGMFVFGALFAACSATKATSNASTDSSSTSSSSGKTVHDAYCLSCHISKAGHSSYTTSEEWSTLVTRMADKPGANFSSMTTSQRESLIEYLVESSSD